jgi:hypothetical protein
MKKIISILLATVMIFASMASVSAASTFVDVEDKFPWAVSAIEELVKKKIISVGENRMYFPADQVTNEQVIAFLGRSLGVNEEENKATVDYAVSTYESFLNGLATFSTKESAYLMYKGIFTQSEIKTLLQNKSTGVLRHEMAIYITKLMGGEEEVKNQVISTLDYKDLSKIPNASLGYVEFVKNHNIMKGDDLGNFNPQGIVNRAMMAVMLREIYSQLDRTYTNGQIVEVNSTTNEIITRDSDGFRLTNTLNSDTSILVDGKAATVVDLKMGQTITFTKSKGKIIEVDAFTSTADSEVEGYFAGTTTTSTGMGIKVYMDGQSSLKATTYPLATNVLVSYNGSSASISNIKSDDSVLLQIEGGKVVRIAANPKTKTILDATILDISASNSTITLQRKGANTGEEFEVLSSVSVYKNGKSANLSSIFKGDQVDITLTYDKISQIEAVSKSQKVTGVIREVTIGKNPVIKVEVNGELSTYEMSSDVIITFNGEPADAYTAFRVGYTVEMTLDGQVAIQVKVMEKSTMYSIIGTVQDVKANFKFLKVLNSDTNTVEEIFVTDVPAIYDMANGGKLTLSDIKAGMRVVVTGNLDMGTYKAYTIGVIY